MEWVETTGKSLQEAKDHALDRLGVAADEAEFEVLEEPRSGLFGLMRGEARVRARIMPTAVRPKQERRGRGRDTAKSAGGRSRAKAGSAETSAETSDETSDETPERGSDRRSASGGRRSGGSGASERTSRQRPPKQHKEQTTMDDHDESNESPVSPQEVGDAAVAFMDGLARALGADPTTTLEIDGTNLEVRVTGSDLGLLVGPGGRTLTAVQDLVRVAAQRRLGDHDTRLRVDVGGYREKRREALERFAAAVAAQVIESGTPKALEPMASADRKTVHDAIVEIEGVTSHSEGDDPMRRVVITPA
ncbi:MAG TPA: RNA-binding cell elongation regulator Jag/EloR [Ilumatobacter sp.]